MRRPCELHRLRNVRKRLRWFRGDGFLADAETHGSVGGYREHDVGRVVCKRAAIPLQESEHGGRANRIWEEVGAEPARDFFAVGAGVFGCSQRGDDAGNCLRDGLSDASRGPRWASRR